MIQNNLEIRDVEEIRDILRCDFENTAYWRRQKAKEYPEDDRNLEAATILDRLAESTSDVEPKLLDAYGALFGDLADFEKHNELLKLIGFHWEPTTASEFVTEFIKEVTDG